MNQSTAGKTIFALLIGLFLFGNISVFSSLLADEVTGSKIVVRVGAYDNYPKVFKNEKGTIKGLFPEILEAIAEDAGWKIEYVMGTWTQCLERLEKGEIDIMVDVGFSDSRAERFAFNKESILVNWAVVYVQKGQLLETFVDLQDKKIAVMKGSIHTEGANGIKSLLKKFNVNAELVEVENYTKVFELLERQQVDAGVVNRIFGSLFAQDYDLQRSAIIFNPSQLRFAFPLRSPINAELIETIDTGLAKLKKQPQSIYHRAIDAYLSGQPEEIETKEKPEEKALTINLNQKEKEWIRTHPEIRLGVDPEFIPFEYFSNTGDYSGIASDYIKILNQRLGINLKVEKGLTWKQAIGKAKNREIDVLPCVGKTLDRLKYLKYSRPYVNFQRVVITQSDFQFITGLEDLKSSKVAVQNNSSHYGFLIENTDIEPVAYNTLQQALTAVSRGDADAFVGNVASSTFWIRNLNLTNLKVAATVPPEELNLYFAVRADWPELVTIINKGLRSISQEERDRIYQKWITVEYREGIDPKLLWQNVIRIGVIIVAVLFAFIVWNRFLKREINKRREAETLLRYFNQLEHIVSETSSQFISIKNEEIDETIKAALENVTEFVGIDLAGVFEFVNEESRIYCTHHWEAKHYPEAFIDCLETDVEKLPWWYQQMKKQEIFKVSSLDDLPEEAKNLKAFIGDTGIQSFVDIPRIYQEKLVGFLRFGSSKISRVWKDEEIALFKLIGQIITNGLQRAKADQELKAYAEELQTVNKQLKELDKLKSMFIASMSHELRTPLNSIIGFTGIILKGLTGDITEQQKDQLQRVYSSAKHLLNLISDVIDISKIEAGRIDVYPEEFQVSQVIDEAFNSMQPLAEKKNLELEKNVQDDVLLVQDQRRLLQCIINYLSNAIKYTEKGQVTLTAHRLENQFEILVKDTGIGIPYQDLEKLFKPFERLDSHLRIKAGGAGLGLYLTRKIVLELLEGETSIESEFGVGSTFGLKIPLRNSKQSTIATSETV